MSRLLIRGASVLTEDGWLDDAVVLVSDDRIEAVDRAAELADAAGFDEPATVIDADGLLLAPGFIELQNNGGFGHDLTADPASLWALAERLPAQGVTSFLPTVITSPKSTFDVAQAALAGGPAPAARLATPLGFHFEGPFINPKKKGAHDPAHLRLADPDFAASWSLRAGVRLVTLAPELPGALAMVRSLVERGVIVSAGHSMATASEARAGFDAGIRYGTHLFNAMSPLDHRAPGLPGALLTDDRLTVGLIADGLHVDPAVVKVAWRALGPTRMSIVTDAMAAVGLGHGEYPLGSSTVFVTDNGARLADGTLAGSLLRLDLALRNFVEFTGCSTADALRTVTEVPARLLGITGERGRIAAGLLADLVLLTPDLHVAATIVRGDIVFQAESGNGDDGVRPPHIRADVAEPVLAASLEAEGY